MHGAMCVLNYVFVGQADLGPSRHCGEDGWQLGREDQRLLQRLPSSQCSIQMCSTSCVSVCYTHTFDTAFYILWREHDLHNQCQAVIETMHRS